MRAVITVLALVSACSDDATYVVVTIEQGSFPTTQATALRASIELEDGRTASAEPMPPNGNVFLLPSTLSFELRSGDGVAEVVALATHENVSLSGSSEVRIAQGERTDVSVELGTMKMLPTDGGVEMPAISVTPTMPDALGSIADFGVRLKGSTTTRELVVRNTGGPSAALGSLVLSVAPGLAIVDAANMCTGEMLATNGSCMFSLQFAPVDQTPEPSSGGLNATVGIAPYQTQGPGTLIGARTPVAAQFSVTRSKLIALALNVDAPMIVQNESASAISLTFSIDAGYTFTGDAPCATAAATLAAAGASGDRCTLRVRRTGSGSPSGNFTITEGATAVSIPLTSSGT